MGGVRTLSPPEFHGDFDRLLEVAEMADRIMHTSLLNMDITSDKDKCASNIQLHMSVATCLAVKFELDEALTFSEMIQRLRIYPTHKELMHIEGNVLQATNWLKGLTFPVLDS